MKRVILHIPIHKTGSTALQTALFHNEAVLAQQGYTYLASFAHDHQHAFLVETKAEKLRQRLTEAKEQAGDLSVILSTEKAHMMGNEDLQDLFAALFEVFEDHIFQVLVYLRSQQDAFDSYYNQIVKFGTTTGSAGSVFSQFIENFDYKRYLEQIDAKLRSQDTLSVRLYDRSMLVQNDIVADFQKYIGMSAQLSSYNGANNINHSLEKSIFEMKRAMNVELKDAPPKLLQSLAGVLADASSNVNNGKPNTQVLSDLERLLIQSHYAETNAWVEKHYLGSSKFPQKPAKQTTYDSSFETVLPGVLARLSRYFFHISSSR